MQSGRAVLPSAKDIGGQSRERGVITLELGDLDCDRCLVSSVNAGLDRLSLAPFSHDIARSISTRGFGGSWGEPFRT